MLTAMRIILGVIAGALVTLILVSAVEFFSNALHPFPADLEMTKENMCDHVAAYPQWILAMVVALWGGTAFLGVWVAQKIGNPIAALITAGLILWGLSFNLYLLPYPLWFKIVMPTAAVIAVVLAFTTPLRRGAREPRGSTPTP